MEASAEEGRLLSPCSEAALSEGPRALRPLRRRLPWRPALALALAGALACAAFRGASRGHEERPAAKLADSLQAEEDPPGMGQGFPHKSFSPTLFCFSVMQARGPEEELVKFQLKNRRGIFACDDFAVLSPERRYLGYGHKHNGTWLHVYSWYNPAPQAIFGDRSRGDATDSFKNTAPFIEAWDTLSKAKALQHDWTAKVDPDAVFFPYRLRRHVAHLPVYTPMYLKNCQRKEGWTDDYLFGALEVFNLAATNAYAARGWECKRLASGGWGEDMWIAKCMEHLGAQMHLATKLVGDRRCVYASCSDVWRAAFHDYKSVEAWHACWLESARSEKALADAKRAGTFCCNGPDPCGNCSRRLYPGEDWCTSEASCGSCGVRPGGCGF